jgi:hypothetical protein
MGRVTGADLCVANSATRHARGVVGYWSGPVSSLILLQSVLGRVGGHLEVGGGEGTGVDLFYRHFCHRER